MYGFTIDRKYLSRRIMTFFFHLLNISPIDWSYGDPSLGMRDEIL